jgi:hypothetical protein
MRRKKKLEKGQSGSLRIVTESPPMLKLVSEQKVKLT